MHSFFSSAHGTCSRTDHTLGILLSCCGSTFRFTFQIKPSHLAPAGEGPFHTELLVTGLGVYRPFGELRAHVVGHGSGDSRGFQLLAGHPAGLNASSTAPGTGWPGSHHPPVERKRGEGSCKRSWGEERCCMLSEKEPHTSPCSHHTAANLGAIALFSVYTWGGRLKMAPQKKSTSNPWSLWMLLYLDRGFLQIQLRILRWDYCTL